MLYVVVHPTPAAADGPCRIDDKARLLARRVLLHPTQHRQRHARDQRLEQLALLWVLQPIVVHQGHLHGDRTWAGDRTASPAFFDVDNRRERCGGEGAGHAEHALARVEVYDHGLAAALDGVGSERLDERGFACVLAADNKHPGPHLFAVACHTLVSHHFEREVQVRVAHHGRFFRDVVGLDFTAQLELAAVPCVYCALGALEAVCCRWRELGPEVFCGTRA